MSSFHTQHSVVSQKLTQEGSSCKGVENLPVPGIWCEFLSSKRRIAPWLWSRFALFFFLVLSAATLSPGVFGAELVAREPEVKAAYIFNFGLFTDWPTNKFSSTNSPTIIGVLGDPAIAGELEKIARKATIHGRKLIVRRLTANDNPDDCHIIFISRNTDFGPILAKIATNGVLTIGDNDNFAKRGGMINFVLVGETVKFDVNHDVASHAGLTLSSKLLGVAHSVIKSEPGKETK